MKRKNPLPSTLLPEIFPAAISANFDDDNQPDLAELSSNRTIKVTFGNSLVRYLSSGSSQLNRGRLVSVDIDNDDDQDLIWIAKERLITPAIWLGNGHGSFVKTEQVEFTNLPAHSAQLDSNSAKVTDSQENDNLLGDSLSENALGLFGKGYLGVEYSCQTLGFSFHHHSGISQCLTHLSKRGPPLAHSL